MKDPVIQNQDVEDLSKAIKSLEHLIEFAANLPAGDKAKLADSEQSYNQAINFFESLRKQGVNRINELENPS